MGVVKPNKMDTILAAIALRKFRSTPRVGMIVWFTHDCNRRGLFTITEVEKDGSISLTIDRKGVIK